jgi:murein DD-endopeptidase MepM/ murein hydrolase activator NlpD
MVAMRALVAVLLIPLLALAPAPAAAAPERSPTDPDWAWPTEVAHRVERPFVAPASDYGAGHRGVDLAAGETLLAPADGTVSFAGTVVDRGVLSIDHGGGVVSSFEPVTTTLHTGDVVHRGDRIATIDAGHCAVSCVHMGVRVDGDYITPLLFLGGVPHAVLLPTRPIGSG